MRLFVPKWLNSKLPAMVQKIFARASILLHNVSHQAQVALNQDVASLQIALGGLLQIVPFLLRRQGAGEAAGG